VPSVSVSLRNWLPCIEVTDDMLISWSAAFILLFLFFRCAVTTTGALLVWYAFLGGFFVAMLVVSKKIRNDGDTVCWRRLHQRGLGRWDVEMVFIPTAFYSAWVLTRFSVSLVARSLLFSRLHPARDPVFGWSFVLLSLSAVRPPGDPFAVQG